MERDSMATAGVVAERRCPPNTAHWGNRAWRGRSAALTAELSGVDDFVQNFYRFVGIGFAGKSENSGEPVPVYGGHQGPYGEIGMRQRGRKPEVPPDAVRALNLNADNIGARSKICFSRR